MNVARYQLVVEYDGTDFHGWQAQEGQRTVEGCLREALAQLSPNGCQTHGASRTDRGVHALGQRVLVELDRVRPASELLSALQALTPPDVGVLRCEVAAADFHPRFSALEKRYLYQIRTGQQPPTFARQNRWWIREPLDVDAMNEGAALLVGEHDFAGLRNRSKDEPEDTVRVVRAAEWRQIGHELFFQVIGEGFLYKMVRNCVGTLVEVGKGQRTAQSLQQVLSTGERQLAGLTAPPHGLYLMEVRYPGEPPCALQAQPLGF
ncbi:MAG: tRNA pseudouridine(38-40) synthase TruA [Planctomycetota bacterium]